MNAAVQALLWCVLQVTVLSVAALGLVAIVGRRRPAAGALVSATALVAVAGLTAIAFSPWPAWRPVWDSASWWHAADAGAVLADKPAVDSKLSVRTIRLADDPANERPPSRRATPKAAEGNSFASKAWMVLADHWAAFASMAYAFGVGVVTIRIGLGLVAVRNYRRNARPIVDRRLSELVDVVSAELSCRRAVELRETDALCSPATVGGRRPILLLPVGWSDWSDDECLAVLSHEIEHVRRRDFSSWMAAHVSLALHFYHPLVHALVSRLRLAQELSADAAAARVVGGQRKYLTILAAMALRQSDSPIAWPVRAFFPTSKTFLRRIEMLHRSTSLRSGASRSLVCFCVAAVMSAALCAAGIRGSHTGGEGLALADDNRPAGKAEAASAPQPAVPEVTGDRAQSNQSKNNLKQLALAMHNFHSTHGRLPPAVVLGPDGTTPHSWRVELLPYLDQKDLYDRYRMNEPWNGPHNKELLKQMPDVFRSPFADRQSTNSGYYVVVGRGTIFEDHRGARFADIIDGTSNTLLVVESKRNVPWTEPDDIAFDPEKGLPKIGGYVEGEFLAAMADGAVRRFEVDKVKDRLKWLIMRNDTNVIDWHAIGFEQRRPGAPRRPAAADKVTRTKNNLKTLGLGMYLYHDVHRHFPPAVIIGPDGTTPHSWRVELLPYLDQKSLYDQYQLNEPWDSPANRNVLAQIPDVFRSPYDDPKSSNSGYYAIVGPGTVFEGTKGVRILDIADGTSNTLMLVEAKRNIPWTKPEDIPFDPDKSLPDLGGFVEGQFAAATADGAGKVFETARIKDQLKWLIVRDDGHPIHWP